VAESDGGEGVGNARVHSSHRGPGVGDDARCGAHQEASKAYGVRGPARQHSRNGFSSTEQHSTEPRLFAAEWTNEQAHALPLPESEPTTVLGPARLSRRTRRANTARSPKRRRFGLAEISGLVLGASEAGDERDASYLRIAAELVLARVLPTQRPASVLPTAVRTAEGEVVDLRHPAAWTAMADSLLLRE